MRATTYYQEILNGNPHGLPAELPMTVQVTAVQAGLEQLTLHAPAAVRGEHWCGQLLLQQNGTAHRIDVTERDCTVAEAVTTGHGDVDICSTCVADYDAIGQLAAMLDQLQVANARATRISELFAGTGAGFPDLRARNVVALRRELGWTPTGDGFLQKHARSHEANDPALRSWWTTTLRAWRSDVEALRLTCRQSADGWDGERCYLTPHHRLWEATSPANDTLAQWLAGAEVVASAPEGRLPDLPVFEVPASALDSDLTYWACLGPAGTGPSPVDRLHAYLALRDNDQHTDQDVVDAMVAALV